MCSLLDISHPWMCFTILSPIINIFFSLTDSDTGIETCDDVWSFFVNFLLTVVHWFCRCFHCLYNCLHAAVTAGCLSMIICHYERFIRVNNVATYICQWRLLFSDSQTKIIYLFINQTSEGKIKDSFCSSLVVWLVLDFVF